MQERTRALKRHHAARLKTKRTRYVNAWIEATRPVRVPTDKEIGRKACTPANCSCYMCGNPRKFNGELTLEEYKFLYLQDEGILELQVKDVYNSRYTEPHKWSEAEKEINKNY